MSKILLSTGSLYTYGLNRSFELASLCGYDGIELIVSNSWDTHQPEYLRELARTYKIPILAIHAPAREIKEWAKGKLDTLEKTLQLAEELGAKTVNIHPNGSGLAWQKKLLQELPRLRRKYASIAIVVENLPRKYKTKYLILRAPKHHCYNPEHMKPFGQLCLDTSHIASLDIELMQFYYAIKNQISHLHLSDDSYGIGDKHLLPGLGNLPLKKLLNQLKSDHYRGLITLELCPTTLKAGESDKKVLNRLKDALNFTRDALK